MGISEETKQKLHSVYNDGQKLHSVYNEQNFNLGVKEADDPWWYGVMESFQPLIDWVSTNPSLALFLGCVVSIPIATHALPGPMPPGSRKLILVHFLFAAVTGCLTYLLVQADVDPYAYGVLYGGALMVLCTECWFREDPRLFNGSGLGGWPFFLFHAPGETSTKAAVPQSGYTRVFSSWHAGGVVLCFFVHVVGGSFPEPQKVLLSLALGLLWIVWAAINSYRAVYGAAQFCQVGILFHSLVGPGCGLAGYCHLAYYVNHRDWEMLTVTTNGNLPTQRQRTPFTEGEKILCGTFLLFVIMTLGWFVTQPRREAVSCRQRSVGRQ